MSVSSDNRDLIRQLSSGVYFDSDEKVLKEIAKKIAGKNIKLPMPKDELCELTLELTQQEALDETQVNSAIAFSLVVLNSIAMYQEG